MKLFWIIFFLTSIISCNGYHKIIEEKEGCENIAQTLLHEKSFLETSPLPIQFIFVLRTNSPEVIKQLQLYHFINCFIPSINNKQKFSTKLLILSSAASPKILSFNQTIYNSLIATATENDSSLSELSESKTSLCLDFLKAVDYLFSHQANRWETSAKNFILFNFNSNDSDSCKEKYEEYMAERGSSIVGTFLNVIHVNSTLIPEEQQSDLKFENDQRFFLGYQIFINSSSDIGHFKKYYGIFRYFTKQMIESSIIFTKYYYKYLSNTSLIHLNQEYFQEDPELGKVSDMHLIVMAFIRLCIIGLLILLITILTLCVLATSLTSLVVVLDNIDYQIGLIRNADIFNPQPTPRAVESVTSDPKLAPQPVLERSFSSVIWCDNLFTNDGWNTSHDLSDIELDETQSLTSFASFESSSNV